MGGRWCRGIQACSLEVVQEWWLNCLVVLALEPAELLVQHLLECGYSLNIENNLKCSTKLQLHWAYCGKHCLNVLRYYLVKVCCKLQYSRHCLWRELVLYVNPYWYWESFWIVITYFFFFQGREQCIALIQWAHTREILSKQLDQQVPCCSLCLITRWNS